MKRSPTHRLLLLSAAVGLSMMTLASPARAQDPARQPPPEVQGLSTAEIVSRLQASGMSRQQVRSRLQDAGRDPSLADPYFDIIESGADPSEAGIPAPTTDFLASLQNLGIVNATEPGAQQPQDEEAPEERELTVETAGAGAPGALRVFGRDVFSGTTSEFQPLTTGPVAPDYRLGPGDQIVLIMTGDVERAYELDVTREGFIVIPQVGQIQVNGLTMADLENVLYRRLGQAYSGLRRGDDAATFFSASLGRLRRNQVYFLGEVSRRGAAQISSVSTLFNALYVAGGPNPAGSFRRVQVRRGGTLLAEVDLYAYLLSGSTGEDLRMENGDVVFVPLAGKQVTVRGNVRRTAIFELTEGEGLMDALTFAGGFQPDAFTGRIQIDRILPPELREPGRERVLIDVDPERLAMGGADMALRDGDVIQLYGISDERRNRVTIRGDVFRPATYEFVAGMTLPALIGQAQGLLPSAYRAVAHVIRVDPSDGSRDLERVPLTADSTGALEVDYALEDMDEVVVYGRASLRETEWVEVSGPVREPGRYPFADGMTVRDLALAAGGARPELLATRATISRLRPDFTRTLLRYELHPDSMGVPTDEIPLQSEDRVSLYDRRALQLPRAVSVRGEIQEPGEYELADSMTVQDLLLEAGGFRKAAMQLEVEVARPLTSEDRTDTLVTVHRVRLRSRIQGSGEVEPAAADPVSTWSLDDGEFHLMDGDVVFVRRLPGYVEASTVTVDGQVEFPGPYALQRRGEILSQLVDRAGGITTEAYLRGARLVRDSMLVAVDLQRALDRPGGDADVPLFPGDRLVVPEYDPTVLVTGAVGFSVRIPYRSGWSARDYIDRAGGFAENADEERLRVVYPNGEAGARRSLLLFSVTPNVQPGSLIHVPQKPPSEVAEEGIDWDAVLSRTLSIAGTVATLLIAIDRVGN